MDLTFYALGWEGQRPAWSYEGFNTFRTRLAALSGVVLTEMQGYGGNRKWKGVALGGIGELIRHVDDDGILTAAVCGRLAPNLEALVNRLDPGDPVDNSMMYDISMGQLLVRLMRFCDENKVDLEFHGTPVVKR